MTNDINELLNSKSIANVRKACRAIQESPDSSHCNRLVELLEQVLSQPRKWETACLILTAIGNCECKSAIDLVERACMQEVDHSMVCFEAAKTFVRLTRKTHSDVGPINTLISSGGYSAKEGALDVLGRDQMTPSIEDLRLLIQSCKGFGLDRNASALSDPRYGLAAVCAGYSQDESVRQFLNYCMDTGDEPVKHVASNALQGNAVRLR